MPTKNLYGFNFNFYFFYFFTAFERDSHVKSQTGRRLFDADSVTPNILDNVLSSIFGDTLRQHRNVAASSSHRPGQRAVAEFSSRPANAAFTLSSDIVQRVNVGSVSLQRRI